MGDAQLFALAAAVSLALAASPISWYHYQLLQLPGLALLACRWTARATTWRQVLFGLLALAALADGLTRTDLIGVGSYLGRYGWTAANLPWLWLSSSLVPILSLVHFGLQVREMRPQRRFAAVK